MKELEIIELQEIELSEIIAYSKKYDSLMITITDELNAGLFNYFTVVADKLKLIFFIVKGTKKLAFIGNSRIIKKICEISKVNYQILMSFEKGKLSERKNITKAYNYIGQPVENFIDINITEDMQCPTLEKYDFIGTRYCMSVRGRVNNKIENFQRVLKDRIDFLKNEKLDNN